MPHRTYNTPKRKCVVKTRLTEDERRAFEDKCAALSMSQSEYIRQAIFYSRIAPVIRVTAHSEEMLTAVSSLVAQYGKIGSNLNQIARYLNEYGAPYNALSSEVRAAVSDLAALKFEVLKVITYWSMLCWKKRLLRPRPTIMSYLQKSRRWRNAWRRPPSCGPT